MPRPIADVRWDAWAQGWRIDERDLADFVKYATATGDEQPYVPGDLDDALAAEITERWTEFVAFLSLEHSKLAEDRQILEAEGGRGADYAGWEFNAGAWLRCEACGARAVTRDPAGRARHTSCLPA